MTDLSFANLMELIDRLRMDVASAQSRATTAERQRTDTAYELDKATERIDELVQRPPEHEFSPDESGHNCAHCDPASIWKCDATAHFSMPRWEDDKLVKERGWDTPQCCKKCGEPHAGYLKAEAERDRYRAVVEAARAALDAWDRLNENIVAMRMADLGIALGALHATTEEDL